MFLGHLAFCELAFKNRVNFFDFQQHEFVLTERIQSIASSPFS